MCCSGEHEEALQKISEQKYARKIYFLFDVSMDIYDTSPSSDTILSPQHPEVIDINVLPTDAPIFGLLKTVP